jgi:hypothetical protein
MMHGQTQIKLLLLLATDEVETVWKKAVMALAKLVW